MKNERIIIVLAIFLVVLASCYLPKGAWVTTSQHTLKSSNDSIFIALPIDFQKYNYFKVTYLKNKSGWPVEKYNDSTLVFIPSKEVIFSPEEGFRVEAGILPFF